MTSKREGAIIILEGADASGKSTLALAIAAEAVAQGSDFTYLHGQPWPGTVVEEHQRMATEALRAVVRGSVVVFDHFWIAEQLYGAEYRGAPAYDPTLIDQEMRLNGALLVLCVPTNLSAQIARHAERRAKGKEHFDHATGIVTRYAELCAGNADKKGDGYLDRVTRSCRFFHRDDSMHYDMDHHEPSVWGKQLIANGRDFRRIKLQHTHQAHTVKTGGEA